MRFNFLQKYRHIVSIGLGIFLSLVVILFWKANNKQFQQSLEDKVTDTNQLVIQQLQGVLFDKISKLKNLKRRLEITDGNYFEYLEKDAALIIKQNPSFHFVEWIDSTGVIQLAEPLNDNKEVIGLNITTLDYRKSGWLKTKKDSVFNLTRWLQLVQGDSAFLIDQPIFIGNQFYGTVTAGIDLSQRFNSIMDGLEEYHLKIKDDQGTVFYTFGDSAGTEQLTFLGATKKIPLHDANNSTWSITMVPNHLFLESNSIYVEILNLILALVLCWLVSLSFFFRQRSSVAEASQKETNTKLRSLIDSSPLAICVINTDGIVIDFWNDAAEEMFGWNKEEVIGNFLPFITDHTQDEFNRLMEQCIREGKIKDQEIVRSRKDGSKGVFLLNIGAITGEQMLVLIEDISEFKHYEHQLEESIREKEILLTEIHHRVKNNLAIIAGLIELQKDRINDEQTNSLLNETQNRIYSISGVHELLYEADNFSEINLESYLDRLLDRLQSTYQNADHHVEITKNLNSFSVNINQAIPLGLLLNELITNSYKHAFADTEHPSISLSLEELNGNIKIRYHDNGSGLKQAEFESGSSLGLNLIHSLLRQIEADYQFHNKNGFEISFTFEIGDKGSHSNI